MLGIAGEVARFDNYLKSWPANNQAMIIYCSFLSLTTLSRDTFLLMKKG